jgi:RimJ/RimL family protein N-acetyltransferase
MSVLWGSRVILRLLRKEFFAEYAARFSPIVRTILHVPTIDHEISYLEQRLEKMGQGKTLFYCVIDTRAHHLIGGIEIRDRSEHYGQLYSWLHEMYWGTGQYKEALSLAAQSYFKMTEQLYFTAHVDISNQRSYHALKKCGFAHAGFFNGPYGKQYALILRNK